MGRKEGGGISKVEVEVDGLSGKGGEEGEKECAWQMKEGKKEKKRKRGRENANK